MLYVPSHLRQGRKNAQPINTRVLSKRLRAPGKKQFAAQDDGAGTAAEVGLVAVRSRLESTPTPGYMSSCVNDVQIFNDVFLRQAAFVIHRASLAVRNASRRRVGR